MNKDCGYPAFPSEGYAMDGTPLNELGMSLRDYAVIKFMAAQIAYSGMGGQDVGSMVDAAGKCADVMLETRQ